MRFGLKVQNRNYHVRRGTEKRVHGSDQVINALLHLIGVASLYIVSVSEVTENIRRVHSGSGSPGVPGDRVRDTLSKVDATKR
ncbi:hypothetical protein CY34DRAFT_227572 [Suillus luteus UH-Slu-Lm8-n1]|uniref:Unplaced genomic scaffold CY34scaffold_149, whole genome shotgun sequence n=1 Tax=Suillus luteus UH-Slu-Lm8-n1 TaxID=930992 RepID=A0A0D0AGZ3_9AGAM|nr:hypothetical protein CY34DRAFT_227572 [Suillus luteus UH-Slu-Lm8-n1]